MIEKSASASYLVTGLFLGWLMGFTLHAHLVNTVWWYESPVGNRFERMFHPMSPQCPVNHPFKFDSGEVKMSLHVRNQPANKNYFCGAGRV